MTYSIKADMRKRKGRRAVIGLLKTEGATTATAISKLLGVTSMAVRQHLYELADQGLVDFEERRNGLGRPAKYWRLTQTSNSFFYDGHADLAVGLIHTVRSIYGAKGIQDLINVRIKTQQKIYGKVLKNCKNIKEKLEALAKVRCNEGYMSQVVDCSDGVYMFEECHYPIFAAAQACPSLCASEIEVFQSVLGSEYRIERTHHILTGASKCIYRICNSKG